MAHAVRTGPTAAHAQDSAVRSCVQAKLQSDDAATASRGGDLGTVIAGSGVLPEALELDASALQVNGVSEILSSDLGLILLLRTA